MAVNTFETTNWFAMECLALLESKRSVSQFFNTDYQKDYRLKFPVGESINVPYPQQFRGRSGLTYNAEAINRRHATITMLEPIGVDFEIDSVENALKNVRTREKFSKEVLDPAMSRLTQDIDSACAQYAYQYAASLVGVLGTNPTTYDSTSAAARQAMNELACPESGDRGMIVPPVVMRSIKTTNITLMNPQTDISKQFRNGYVSYSDGYDWYESMSLYRHTAGTWAGSVTVSTAPVDGASTLVVACTNGDTFKKGDKFSVASVLPVHPQTYRTFGTAAKTWTITANATGASSLATLSVAPAFYGPLSQYQNCDALPVAAAVLTLWPGTASPNGKVGTVGVALHRDAFALVSTELEEPKGSSVELAWTRKDPDSGVSISFVRQFDARTRKMLNRFDTQIGLGYFYNDACAVAVACG
jgi:hypothetical protein